VRGFPRLLEDEVNQPVDGEAITKRPVSG